MIVVEGPDGAGKTTLIKSLQEELQIPVAPRVVTKGTEAMVNLKDWVNNNLDEGFQPTIFDRYRLISEPIYGPILRNRQEPGFDRLEWLAPRLRRFYDLSPIIIYCLPPLEVVKANLIGDDDNKEVVGRIDGIYSAYVAKAAIDLTYSPGITKVWDYQTTPKINNLPFWFNQIRAELETRAAA